MAREGERGERERERERTRERTREGILTVRLGFAPWNSPFRGCSKRSSNGHPFRPVTVWLLPLAHARFSVVEEFFPTP